MRLAVDARALERVVAIVLNSEKGTRIGATVEFRSVSAIPIKCELTQASSMLYLDLNDSY